MLGLPEMPAAEAYLLPDSSAVVYRPTEDLDPFSFAPPEPLRLRHRDGTEESLLVTGDIQGVSDDGSTVVFLRRVNSVFEVFVYDLGSRAGRQITFSRIDTRAAAVGPDGSYVVLSRNGSLERVSTADLGSETLLGPLPDFNRGNCPGFILFFTEDCRRMRGSMSPGSTYRMAGGRLALETTLAGDPPGAALDGIGIEVGGVPAALLWTSPSEVGFQLAWETASGEAAQMVVSHESSGWEAVLVARSIERRLPRPALRSMEGFDVAAHQDFDRLVTREDPANPGELIHLYATGLGDVTPPAETGRRASADPLARLVEPCNWIATDELGPRPGDVLFAGLAPGLIGYYQVVWRIPDDVAGDSVALGCDDEFNLGVYPVRTDK